MGNHVLITDYLWFQEGPGVRNTQYTSSGVKLLNVANFVDGNIDLSTSSRYISDEEAYGKYKHFLVDEGDFLIASSGIQVDYFEKKIGFIRPDQLPLCMNTSTIRFKNLKPDDLDMRYFMYYLKSNAFKNQLSKHIVGSAQLNFGPSHLKKMTFPVVNIERQRYIVENLDKLYTLIALRKEQLAKLDQLVKARFVEMFGDMLLNNMVWPEAQLCTLADVVSGITKGRKIRDTELFEVPYMAVSNVKDGYIDWTTVKTILASKQEIAQYRLMPHDVLMTEGGDPDKLGRGAVITNPLENSIHQNHIFRVRLNTEMVLPIFFSYYLQQQKAKRYFLGCAKQTTGIASINMKQLRALPVLLPTMELQTEFATFVEQTSRSKLTIQQSLDKLETLRKSLMQEYFG